MSDVMFYGVLRMPFDMAMSDPMSQFQFYERAQEAAARVETAEAALSRLQAENEGLREAIHRLLAMPVLQKYIDGDHSRPMDLAVAALKGESA